MGRIADLAATLAPWPVKVAALVVSAVRSLSATGAIIAGLALAVTVQTIRLDGLRITPKAGPFHFTLVDRQGWRPRAEAAEKALKAVADAQPKAEAAQAAVNHQPAAITAAIAKEADAQTPDYLRRVASAAAAHTVPVGGGLCGAKAAVGGPSQADLPGTDHSAQGDDGKAGPPDMVSVARADWEKLNAEAALRAQLYEVGQSWIADGVAKAEDEVAPPNQK
jgi:hypothetical protein